MHLSFAWISRQKSRHIESITVGMLQRVYETFDVCQMTSATKTIRFNRFNAYSIQRQVHRESRKVRFYRGMQRI